MTKEDIKKKNHEKYMENREWFKEWNKKYYAEHKEYYKKLGIA